MPMVECETDDQVLPWLEHGAAAYEATYLPFAVLDERPDAGRLQSPEHDHTQIQLKLLRSGRVPASERMRRLTRPEAQQIDE